MLNHYNQKSKVSQESMKEKVKASTGADVSEWRVLWDKFRITEDILSTLLKSEKCIALSSLSSWGNGIFFSWSMLMLPAMQTWHNLELKS